MYNDDILMHIGVGHEDSPPGPGSGRLPWGSGKNPHQHEFNLLSEYKKLRKDGLSDAECAKILLGEHKKANDMKAALSIYKSEQKRISIAKAQDMLEKCNGNVSEAARRLGMKNESSLRSLLNPLRKERASRYEETAKVIKDVVDKKGIVDVSSDANISLGVPKNTMDIAVSILEQQGYVKTYVKIPQFGTGHETNIKVLATPDMSWSDIQKKKFEVASLTEYSPDGGKTFRTVQFPESLDSKRIMVRYNEEGGAAKDGVIELRPGVKDLSLGGASYSQVRIAVDGTHYIKGMAMYAYEDMPKGIDVIINSNKSKGTPLIGEKDHEVLKRMKINESTGEVDRDNPFGATIKTPKDRDGVLTAGGQSYYIDSDGKKKLSKINKVNDEGDWENWSRNISSQFLSKQPIKLIKQQTDLTIASKKSELDDIMRLTNPVIKKKMLENYADGCDALATKLKAKGFKNQSFQVLLPVPSLKSNEVYAPNYKDGDTVALVRYPHGGIFEIPILTVNNKNKDAKKALGNTRDAIGINHDVANILSGADHDGDAATVIPVVSNRIKVSHRDPLPGLKNFDPKLEYKLPDDAPRMSSKTKGIQMGIVTNLITDMTVGGASFSEIERAVKHSMVVIDAEKHHLDYKKSAKDNGIDELREKWQGKNQETGRLKGASTIISQASATSRIPERKEITRTSDMTPEELKRWNAGKKVYRDTGKTLKTVITDTSKMTEAELKLHNAGKKVYRDTGKLKTVEVDRMSLVDNAKDLVRDKYNEKEMLYANYANSLKKLADDARKAQRSIKPTKVNETAKMVYAREVESLNKKLIIAKSNNPKERQATTIANRWVSEKVKSNPGMDYDTRKKLEDVMIQKARAVVGAKKERVVITDKEWEAIQNNAISHNKLEQIVNNSNLDKLKQLATPKMSSSIKLTNSKIGLAKAMYSSGMYTIAEIAERLGVSTSTVSKAIKGGE